jgi:pimeloyl-ACP methyl ester carboxylesterase
MQGLTVHPKAPHRPSELRRETHPMSFLKRIASLVGRSINKAVSIVQKAQVTQNSPDEALRALPTPLQDALTGLGTRLDAATVTRPNWMVASAAKGKVPAPGGAVALSTDAAGVVHWHLPKPGGLVEIWVERAAAAGRKVVVAHLPALGAAGVGALRQIEHVSKQPPMKHFPDRSLEEAGIAGGIRQVLQGPRTLEKRPGDGPVLILIHGIFDFAFGAAFAPILLRGDLLRRLHDHYNGRVFGFDHPTLSVGPLENANDLIERLPPETPIDILCHSRGGLVTRTLVQHPVCQTRLTEENIKIRNVIFMGAANEGSPLAEPGNLEDLFTVFTGMFSARTPADGLAAHFDLMINAARVLFAPAADLPGITALRPGSELIRDLSRATTLPVEKYTFISANFDQAANGVVGAVESISDRVFVKPNDLVVPFEGMTKVGNVPPRQAPGDLALKVDGSQGNVYHLNYLDSHEVREHIAEFLGVP